MSNFQLNLDEITPEYEPDFLLLDWKYRSAYIVCTALVYFSLMVFALLLLLTNIPWLFISAESILAAACIINLMILPKAYFHKGYAIREHDISYCNGIMFPKITTIPFLRIQQVSIKQNPVSRLFHLYSVEIVNGAQGMDAITIPGLSEETANKIKTLLTDKLRHEHD